MEANNKLTYKQEIELNERKLYVMDQLRQAKEYFKAFDRPYINHKQFWEGKFYHFLLFYTVLEVMGGEIKGEDEVKEYFSAVDTDHVSTHFIGNISDI